MSLFARVMLAAKAKGFSQSKVAEFIGVSSQAFSKWRHGDSQNNLWPHLQKIEKLLPDVRREWLWWGEGEMLTSDIAQQVRHQVQKSSPIPLVGFASCSTFGWYGTMTIPVSVEPPSWHEGMIAVMATGESMLPAGIGHGQICFCDTTKEPGTGEAVYVEQQDRSGTIKLFCERTVLGGGEPAVRLQGWLDREQGKEGQKTFFLEVVEQYIMRVAPVIYVRRRL